MKSIELRIIKREDNKFTFLMTKSEGINAFELISILDYIRIKLLLDQFGTEDEIMIKEDKK